MTNEGKTLSPMKIISEDMPYFGIISNDQADQVNWEIDTEGELAVDVIETSHEIIIRSAIAGVRPEDLSIYVTLDTATIRGTREACDEFIFSDVHVQECHWGSFSRTVILPNNVRVDDSVATMKNGILTVRLPKSDSASQIEVLNEN